MQAKKAILAIICVSILWSIMDFVVHGHLLSAQYQATAHLWRPMEEMNPMVQWVMTLIFSCLYVLFYLAVVQVRTVPHGFKFGVCYGLISGFSMFGMTCYMPIPMSIGAGWFAACLIESIVTGVAMGYITKE